MEVAKPSKTAIQQHIDEMKARCREAGFQVRVNHRKLHEPVSIGFPQNSDEPQMIGVWEVAASVAGMNDAREVLAEEVVGYTIARLEREDAKFVGHALCSAKDRYRGDVGTCIALARAAKKAGVSLKGIR